MRRHYSIAAYMTGLIFFLASGEKCMKKEKLSPIVLKFTNEQGAEIKPLDRMQEKEMKSYFKTKGIERIEKEMAPRMLQKQQQDITWPFYKDGSFEKNESKIKELLASLPEIARWTSVTLYGNPSFPDSSAFSIVTFPWNKSRFFSYQKNFYNNSKASIVNCLQSWLDSCVNLGYFNP